MKFDDIVRMINSAGHLGNYTVINHRECVKDLIVYESVANSLKQDIPKPWKVIIEKYDHKDGDKESLVKVKILNEVAEIVDEMIIYNDINENDIFKLKNYREIALRIIADRYESINNSIEKYRDSDKTKIIIYGPIIGGSKKILDEILKKLE